METESSMLFDQEPAEKLDIIDLRDSTGQESSLELEPDGLMRLEEKFKNPDELAANTALLIMVGLRYTELKFTLGVDVTLLGKESQTLLIETLHTLTRHEKPAGYSSLFHTLARTAGGSPESFKDFLDDVAEQLEAQQRQHKHSYEQRLEDYQNMKPALFVINRAASTYLNDILSTNMLDCEHGHLSWRFDPSLYDHLCDPYFLVGLLHAISTNSSSSGISRENCLRLLNEAANLWLIDPNNDAYHVIQNL